MDMGKKGRRRNSVRLFMDAAHETSPVSADRAKILLENKLAIKYNPMDGREESAILLMTPTIKAAFEHKAFKQARKKSKAICWECGRTLNVLKANIRNRCKRCEEKYKKLQEQKTAEYARLKAEMMLERALKLLEGQEFPVVIVDYKEASDAIAEKIAEEPNVFDSAHEMLAAMELIRNKIKVKLQQKIAGNRVDMVIPDLRVVLEIDGYLHDYRPKKDKQRDLEVRKELGAEWEVVRIPTKYIEQNIKKLLPAIKAIKKYIKMLRAQNEGILPEYFSVRDKALWRNVKKYAKQA